MKKLIAYLTTILTLCSLSAAFAFAEPSASDDHPGALFLPSSYEQYLELTKPSDFAISERYIAIADNQSVDSAVIYLYDKSSQEYRSYSYATQNTLSSLNFYSCSSGDYLFFLETGNYVNYISCNEFSSHERIESFRASAMLINGNEIYYAIQTGSNSNVYYATIEELNIQWQDKQINEIPFNTDIKPSFSLYNGIIYFSSNKNVYKCSPDSVDHTYDTADTISNFTIIGENKYDIVYSNTGGFLYLKNESESVCTTKNITVVKYYKDLIYALTPNGIVQYDLAKKDFTDYEIGKYSLSDNRLNAATDLSIYDDKLIIADNGNKRVTVYDGISYKNAAPATAPEFVCAGKEAYLVVSGSKAYLYDYENNSVGNIETIENSIISVTYAMGTFYILSNDGANSYAVDESTATIREAGTPNIENPVSVAADIYGNLFVLSKSGQIDKYAEAQFLASGTSSSVKITQMDSSCKKLLVDFAGNLYGLSENKITIFSQGKTNTREINFSEYVYGGGNKKAISFAFGLTDGSAYILSDGFIVRTDLGISTLNNISADGLYNSLYETQPSKDDLIVEVKAGSVAVSLDIKSLESDSAYLPYRSYRRLEEDRKGVVLGETDAGYVVLFYEYIPVGEGITSPIHTYDVCLIAKGSAETPAVVADYFSEIKKTGYLSSDVNLYSRPAMQEFTIKDRLKRSSAVAVLGKVSLADGSLDNEYYFVQVADAYGFVPATFVTDANIAALDNENFHYQQLKKGKSVTLESEQGARITLENKERLKVYDGATDKEGYCLVSYEKNGVVYFGEIEASSLSEASPLVIVTLVIVMVVTAAVLLSVCYLLLRRKPTLE